MIISQQRGYTLIGVSIALLIAALLTYYALQDQRTKSSAIDYSSVAYSANAVGAGLRSYYSQNCSDGAAMSSPSVSELIADNYIDDPNSINNRMDLSFSTLIENPGSNQAKLIVSTLAPSDNVALQIADENAGANSSGTTINFSYKPKISSTAKNMRFQQMQEYFGDTTCN
jgi:Tfp pilus assembly protein PilX